MRSAAKLNCHLMLPVVDLGPLGPGPLVPPAPRGPAIVKPQKFGSSWFLSIRGLGVSISGRYPTKKKGFHRMELDDVILHVI